MTAKTTLVVDFDRVVRDEGFHKLEKAISPIPQSSYSIGVVLIIPAQKLEVIENIPIGYGRVNYLNMDSFVNSICGHAFFIYDKNKKICELLSMKPGYEQYVMPSLLQTLPNNVTIWVGTPIHDKEFDVLTKLYIDQGFSTPYINSHSPLGYAFPHEALCMTKTNDITPFNSGFTNKLMDYVMKEYKKNQNTCTIKVRISKNTVEYLYALSHMGSTINNKDGVITQNELAGALIVDNIDDYLIHTLVVDKSSIISGTKDGVNVVKSLYNFHTHPNSAYNKYGVTLGWPSPQDYVGFLSSAVINNTIVHYVATLEGLYVIMFHPEWASDIDKLREDVIDDILGGQYMMRNKLPKEDISWFLSKINQITYKGRRLFVTKHLTWSNADSVVTIPYKKINSNCLSHEDSAGMYTKFKKKE